MNVHEIETFDSSLHKFIFSSIFILAQIRCPKHTCTHTHIENGSLFTGLAKRGAGQGG